MTHTKYQAWFYLSTWSIWERECETRRATVAHILLIWHWWLVRGQPNGGGFCCKACMLSSRNHFELKCNGTHSEWHSLEFLTWDRIPIWACKTAKQIQLFLPNLSFTEIAVQLKKKMQIEPVQTLSTWMMYILLTRKTVMGSYCKHSNLTNH